MSSNIFLEYKPLEGGSIDKDHDKWIEVKDFFLSIGEQGEMITPEANFGLLEVNKLVDGATPDLMLHCANGKREAKLVLDVCREIGDENVVVLKYELENVKVVSFVSSRGDTGFANETISFAYNKITLTAIPVDEAGKPGSTAGPKVWDLNKRSS